MQFKLCGRKKPMDEGKKIESSAGCFNLPRITPVLVTTKHFPHFVEISSCSFLLHLQGKK